MLGASPLRPAKFIIITLAFAVTILIIIDYNLRWQNFDDDLTQNIGASFAGFF